MNAATKDERYYKEAKQLYDNDIITRASDNDGYGWALPWNDQNSVRNACTNNPACIAASLLYARTNDSKYLDHAKKLYDYIVKRIMSADGKLEKCHYPILRELLLKLLGCFIIIRKTRLI